MNTNGETVSPSSPVGNQRVFCICKPWSPPQGRAVAVESVSKSVSSGVTVSSEVEDPSPGGFFHSPRQEREDLRINFERGGDWPLYRRPSPSVNVITRRRRLLLLRRRTMRCTAGFACSRPATSPPSEWPEGGCGGGSFSGGPPGPRPPSRSSPATPAAASPAALRSPSVGDKYGH